MIYTYYGMFFSVKSHFLLSNISFSNLVAPPSPTPRLCETKTEKNKKSSIRNIKL